MRLSLLHGSADAHTDGVWCCTWTGGAGGSTDQLMTGSVDETVQLWQEQAAGDGGVGSLQSLHTFTGHSLGVVSVSVCGNLAASSALDSIIRVWDLVSLDTKAIIECNPSETWAIAFNPATTDNQLIAAAGGSSNKVKIWSVKDATEQAVLPMPERTEEGGKKGKSNAGNFTLSVAISPDGTKLAAGAMDGTVGVFDLATSSLIHTLQDHHKAVRSLEFTPDSKQLLTASDDMHVHLSDVSSGSLIEAFSGHSSWVLDVSCHPSGQSFATGSSDNTVKLWDMSTRSCAQSLDQHSNQVWGVAFRGDGLRLASVADDNSVAIFDVA